MEWQNALVEFVNNYNYSDASTLQPFKLDAMAQRHPGTDQTRSRVGRFFAFGLLIEVMKLFVARMYPTN